MLVHCNGDFYSEGGYTPVEAPLKPHDVLRFAPNGGRPCDGAFPYYRILFDDGGLSFAIGWPGQWSARFEANSDGVVIKTGQEKVHFRLMPGETIRTPRMTVLSWTGNTERAINLWRRWYLAHLLPRPDGQPLKPLLASAATEDGEEFTAATEENQLRFIDRFEQYGIRPDVWWIDAGWYPCYNAERERKWWITGSWEPDPERFPHGFKPIADHASQHDTDLLVWFEPERVRPGTRLDTEHPEWLLTAEGKDNRLLFLGNPQCRQWLTDQVCRLIENGGIRIYRQDHNFPPLEHWRQNEAQDRQGINENLHVQGYLAFWDDLLARNPGLWIDSCASGGRCNYPETLRRSVPLHYTDYGYGNHPVKLGFHHTLYGWIPYFKEVTLSWDIHGVERLDREIDRYAFQCCMAPMLFAAIDIRRDDYDYALARDMIALWRRASNFMLYGDYYPLTPFHHSPEKWVARQFDSPEKGCGMIQVIRFPSAPDPTLTVYPQGIDPDTVYQMENSETGETQKRPGHTLLQDGLTFEIPQRSGTIWFYRKAVADSL